MLIYHYLFFILQYPPFLSYNSPVDLNNLSSIRALGPGQGFSLSGWVGSAKSLLLAKLAAHLQGPIVLFVEDFKQADQWADDLCFFLQEKMPVHVFPSMDALPYYNLSPNPDIIMERLGLLWKLTHAKEPSIIVVPIAAGARRLMPRQTFLNKTQTIIKGDTLNRDEWFEQLIHLAYQRVPIVEDKGTFAVRGGIVDLFSPAHDLPCRFEFFGDTLESIRFFDPVTQKTQANTDQAILIPAREILMDVLAKNWTSKLKKICDHHEIPKSERDPVQESLKNQIFFKWH